MFNIKSNSNSVEIAAHDCWLRPRVSRAPRRLLAHYCWLRPRVNHAPRATVGSRLLDSATREPRAIVGSRLLASATREPRIPRRLLAHDCWPRPRVSHAPRATVGSRLLAATTREPTRPGRLLAHDRWLRPRVSHAPRTIVGSLIVGRRATQVATRPIQIRIPSACARDSLFGDPTERGETLAPNEFYNYVVLRTKC